MNNIFENACFGKAYKTKNNAKAVLVTLLHDVAFLVVEDRFKEGFGYNIHSYRLDGICKNYQNLDIVSEWQEEINEEELDKLAKSYDIPVYGDGCAYSDDEWDEIQDWVEDSYKAGYRKAKKN